MDDPTRARAPQGTLSRPEAVDHLARADALLASGDLQDALGLYQRVVGYPGSGDHRGRLAGHRQRLVPGQPGGPGAGELARSGGRRRDPQQPTRPGGASPPSSSGRASWPRPSRRTARPTGERRRRQGRDRLAAGLAGQGDRQRRRRPSRYFARSRGGGAGLLDHLRDHRRSRWSPISSAPPDNSPTSIFGWLLLDKSLVAGGQYWRLFTVALLHESPLHLAFNMYALYLVGPVVERIYGWKLYLFIYLACDLAASVASFVFGDPLIASVGASGAIFGLFGCLFVAGRLHNPVLDRQGRSLAAQVGTLIVLNLVIGFTFGAGTIDNFAHLGGLLAGGWLGFVLVPQGVPTLARLGADERPAPADGPAGLAPGSESWPSWPCSCCACSGVIVGSDPARFAGLQ